MSLSFVGCDGRRSAFVKKASHKDQIKLNELIKEINFDVASEHEGISTFASKDGFRLVSETLANGFAEFRIESDEKTFGKVHLLIGKKFGISKIRNIFGKSIFCGQIFFLR